MKNTSKATLLEGRTAIHGCTWMSGLKKILFSVPVLILSILLLNVGFLLHQYPNRYVLSYCPPTLHSHDAFGQPAVPSFLYSSKKVVPNDKNIFFVESSCAFLPKREPSGLNLNKRQACAVYSTAKYNPSRSVYLYHSCALHGDYYNQSRPFLRSMLDLPNVHVVPFEAEDIYSGTELEILIKNGALLKSTYRIEHNADLLRLVLVYRYGGTYFDLDIVSLKSMDELGTEFCGIEVPYQLGTAAFHFNTAGPGHELLEKILKTISTNFDGKSWAGNGPTVFTSTLVKFCNIEKPTMLTEYSRLDNCNITLQPITSFYPLPYSSWEMFYNGEWEVVKRLLNKTVAVHVWNHMNQGTMKIIVGSNQPYGMIAQEHCLPVYDNPEEFDKFF